MTESRNQNAEAGSQKSRDKGFRIKGLLLPFVFCSLSSVIFGCNGLQEARDIKNAPMPPKYLETKAKETVSSEGSLWKDSGSLFEDRKAKRVNDLVTVLISETSTASKKAATNTKHGSSGDYGLDNLFAMDTNFGIQNMPFIKDYYSSAFSPSAKGSSKSDFKGTGDTSREGKLSGTITAKIVEVLPNENMVIESRKEILVNNEKEILVFRGIIRSDDISPTNTIQSQYVADAQIYLVGDGVMGDKQSQGWLVRALDNIWPF